MEPAEPGQPPRRRARTGRHARAVTLRAHVVAASAQARARRVGDAAGGRWHCGVLARLSGCAGARQLRLRWRLTAHGTWVLGTCCSIPFCRSRASAGLSDAAATRVGAFPAVARRAAARGDAAARYARCCRGAPPVSRASPAVRTCVGNPLLTAGGSGCFAPPLVQLVANLRAPVRLCAQAAVLVRGRELCCRCRHGRREPGASNARATPTRALRRLHAPDLCRPRAHSALSDAAADSCAAVLLRRGQQTVRVLQCLTHVTTKAYQRSPAAAPRRRRSTCASTRSKSTRTTTTCPACFACARCS